MRAKSLIVASQVTVTDADIEAEAKTRGIAAPVAEPAKSELRAALHERASSAMEARWLENLVKYTWIWRRP